MNHLQRFKFLALPVILWTIIGIFVVLFSRWFLEHYLDVFHINQSIWDYWIPFSYALIIWFLVLRARFKLFYKSKWKNNQDMLIFMVINLLIALTIMFSEFVMEYSVLNKVKIETIDDIDASNWNKCYDIDTLHLNKNAIHLYQRAELTGKHNQTLNYYNYFVAPFGSFRPQDTLLWVGKEYHISFSSSENEAYKTNKWNDFYKSTKLEFEYYEKRHKEFLYPVPISGELNNYTSAIERSPQFKNREHRIFELSSLNIYAERNSMAIWCLVFLLLNLTACALFSLLPISNKKGYENYISGRHTITPGEQEIRDILFMRKNLKMMPFISYVMIIVYVLASARDGNLFNIQTSTAFDFGAMQIKAFNDGDYWRIVTSMFLHRSFLHIIGNLVIFIIFGLILEPALGSMRFLLLVIFSGLGAEIVSYNYLPYESVSLGASGFVFGLFGWFFIQAILFRKLSEVVAFSIFLIPVMLLNFIFGMITSNVNNAAHIGGFFSGALLAMIIKPIISKVKTRK